MEKRYQVFISSTFVDLKEEREKVFQTLMEMDCIPAGMEIFPAADEEQWKFIKKVIDDCDYYILIIGGRYGTLSSEGISYTEQEYNYAVEKKIPVIALLHENPGEIKSGKTDRDDELFEKLQKFRDEVSTGRLVRTWKEAANLPGLVSLSLNKTIKTHPAVGWIRGNTETDAKLLNDIYKLQSANFDLEAEIQRLSSKEKTLDIPDLASLDDEFEVHGTYTGSYTGSNNNWSSKITWTKIFGLISPYLISQLVDTSVKSKLESSLFETASQKKPYHVTIDDQDFQSIKIQFSVLKFITLQQLNTVGGSSALFWGLTELGKNQMLKIRSIKKGSDKGE